MHLPLNDKNNPLYALSKEVPCQILVQRQKKRLTSHQLLALPKQQSTKNDMTNAYHPLAQQPHQGKPENKSAAKEQLIKTYSNKTIRLFKNRCSYE